MTLPTPPRKYLDGSSAAALIAAGVGIFAVGLVTPIGAWLMARAHTPCTTTRPLLTLAALLTWLGAWSGLHRLWKERPKPAQSITLAMGILIAAGLIIGSPLLAVLWPQIRLP